MILFRRFRKTYSKFSKGFLDGVRPRRGNFGEDSRDGEIVRGIRERIETRGFNEACNERVEHGPRNPFFVGAAR